MKLPSNYQLARNLNDFPEMKSVSNRRVSRICRVSSMCTNMCTLYIVAYGFEQTCLVSQRLHTDAICVCSCMNVCRLRRLCFASKVYLNIVARASINKRIHQPLGLAEIYENIFDFKCRELFPAACPVRSRGYTPSTHLVIFHVLRVMSYK